MGWIVKENSELLVPGYIQVRKQPLDLKEDSVIDRDQTWCYLGNLKFSNVLSQSLTNLLPRSTPLPLTRLPKG